MSASDLTMTLHWRNSGKVRHGSKHDWKINLEDHEKWFFQQPDTKWVFELNGTAIGVVHLNENLTWSFYLDPDQDEGLGFGRLMLTSALSVLKSVKIPYILSSVLKTNKASLYLHDKLGFKITDETEDELFYRKQLDASKNSS